jgi:hypothetical protein
MAFGQNGIGSANYAPGSFSGWSDVQQFGAWTMHTTSAVGAAGSATVSLDSCYFPLAEGPSYWFPLYVGTYVQVLDPSGTQLNSAGSSEKVYITAVQTPTPSFGSAQPGYACGFTATFSYTHPANVRIVPADKGLSSAVGALSAQGGTIVATPQSGVTTAMITALTSANGTVGSNQVSIVDITGANNPAPVVYAWNGTAYVPVQTPMISPNGAALVPFVSEVNVTLATGATTTAVGTSTFIPANSIIMGVTGRVTTTITSSCTGWEIGDATTAARFTTNNTTLTAGTKSTDTGAFLTTGIASATTGMYQATAEALQITCAGGNPGAGAIRVTAFGFAATPAAQ